MVLACKNLYYSQNQQEKNEKENIFLGHADKAFDQVLLFICRVKKKIHLAKKEKIILYWLKRSSRRPIATSIINAN